MMNSLLKIGFFFLLSVSECVQVDDGQCCKKKSHEGDTYSLVSQDAAGTKIAGCLDDCVYTKESEKGSRYCFKWGTGNTVCKADDLPTDAPVEEPSCPAGWISFQTDCYKVFEETLGMRDAENYCQGEGAHLTSILSEEENKFVAGLAPEQMWIGGTDKANEGSFEWTDGSPFSFTSWGEGQPTNGGNQNGVTSGADNQNCVITNFLEAGHWDDLWCTGAYNPPKFVCKKSENLPTDETGEDTAEEPSCEAEWIQKGSSCYKFFETLKTWNDAEDHCKGEGGHLASIGSDEENEFLIDFASSLTSYNIDNNLLWVGGSDESSEDTWSWTDGTSFTFSDWTAPEPNGADRENCLVVRSSQDDNWNDAPCTEQLKFMCEK